MGFLEFLARIFGIFKQEVKILVIGLDNSGKTTILNRLKPKDLQKEIIVPTIGFNVEKVNYKSLILSCFDMAGQGLYRSLWENYYRDCDAIIYVIDSSDKLRLVVVQDELLQLIEHPFLRERNIPILIFANKMDIPTALQASDVAKALELERIRNKSWNILATNGLTGAGIQEGIIWLTDQIKSKMQAENKR